MYDIYSLFDISMHKQTYINYCEVIIKPDGSIHYAVPSHQRYLEKYGASIYNETEDEFVKRCPSDMWFNYLQWLLDITGCVSCWSEGHWSGIQGITIQQRKSLNELVQQGLVKNHNMGRKYR